jgi:DNA-binding PadR family transcriptional regulator
MHKQLMLLGSLLRAPRHGYELHQMVRAHGELYADLKKANVYYLLGRLAAEGCVTAEAEPGARGPRGEKLVYALADKGRARFETLLRATLRDFEVAHTGLEVALVYLGQLPRAEAVALLRARRAAVLARREQAAADLGDLSRRSLPSALAADHILASLDAELTWSDRALARLLAEPDGAADGGIGHDG